MQAYSTGMNRHARPVVRAIAPKYIVNTATLLIALWLGIAPPASASDHGPLELATAIQAALARSQALSAQDAAARSAREAAVAAGQRPDPCCGSRSTACLLKATIAPAHRPSP